MRSRSVGSFAALVPAILLPLLAVALVPLATVASAASPGADGQGWGGQQGPLTAKTILSGSSLTHTFTAAGTTTTSSEPLSDPDDITRLGSDIFVGFQNGVGPQGQASPSGNLDSTVVEMTSAGQAVGQWDVAGKADGVTADPGADLVIATVNEDANSSLYTITPGPSGGVVQHYSYSEPLPHNGGTDAISIWDGRILISASRPGRREPWRPPSPPFPPSTQ